MNSREDGQPVCPGPCNLDAMREDGWKRCAHSILIPPVFDPHAFIDSDGTRYPLDIEASARFIRSVRTRNALRHGRLLRAALIRWAGR